MTHNEVIEAVQKFDDYLRANGATIDCGLLRINGKFLHTKAAGLTDAEVSVLLARAILDKAYAEGERNGRIWTGSAVANPCIT